ncbi:heterogeneous nuclear ribonucleoprotein L-like [Alosa pseudoharengus]|uniref:heterogeneous nuclear ribonucleoprotein L-like n=1 Tax=Alosa sapidissima TaxID=34773 RepID=UPI001C084D46|nr:heterogeneous nuclear ribonucleoprotein L-like [Alosa sapidissima]XP_048104416.1 heterogeneous nuclear ribonucleoprotein L-like [Alosa alosa]
MSLIEEYGDGEYERAAKRLKTSEVEEGEDLEEGEDSDSASAELLGDEEDETGPSGEQRVRWTLSKYCSDRKDNGDNSHRIAPSPVVHVRGLCESVVEADLVEALEKFGNICYVMMMPFKRQALVEFENLDSADRCVTYGAKEAVYIAGQQAFFNYSTSKRITRPTNADDPNSGNKVLLLSIQNPLYPITTDVLYTVCNPIGNVLRIVIFKRNGIQAMVEFESIQNAQRAKAALNGADIYAGCCTLKIEYARPSRLNVIRNDNDSWDYTKPFLVRRERTKGRQRQAILGEHPSSYGDNGYGSHCPLLPLPTNTRFKRSSHDLPEVVAYPLPQTSSYMGHATSSVAMVSGLHPGKMNCTRIFNLFCLYGNIEKVKFMKSVPGTALVEMGDEYAVDRAITHLNNIKVFSKRLNVCVSKQQAVIPSQVFELEDGSSSYKDFAMTRNNRFTSAGQASKNIIQPPSCVLHFYNVPPCVTEDELRRLCSEHGVPGFIKFKVFDAKPSSKTISGLLEFDSKTDAVEVLTVLNHYQIRIPNGSNPYTLKLCFSTSSHL